MTTVGQCGLTMLPEKWPVAALAFVDNHDVSASKLGKVACDIVLKLFHCCPVALVEWSGPDIRHSDTRAEANGLPRMQLLTVTLHSRHVFSIADLTSFSGRDVSWVD